MLSKSRIDDEAEDLRRELEELRRRLAEYERGWPPGHFYSPSPDLRAIAANESRVFPARPPESLPAIDLGLERQKEWLARIETSYADQPFTEERSDAQRFYFDNDYFRHGEAIALLGIMRFAKPRRVIEVGAGFSTAAMLDIDDLFLARSVEFMIVEPYPERLLSLLREEDRTRIDLREQPVQELDAQEFSGLKAGDVLLIDSAHVSKTDSDLNHLLFRILPVLQEGVLVHFHDIFYPFEYPSKWVYEGRDWNECYLLRAFLQYNSAFRIIFYNSYMHHCCRERVSKTMPLFAQNPGSSLWLQKFVPPDRGTG